MDHHRSSLLLDIRKLFANFRNLCHAFVVDKCGIRCRQLFMMNVAAAAASGEAARPSPASSTGSSASLLFLCCSLTVATNSSHSWCWCSVGPASWRRIVPVLVLLPTRRYPFANPSTILQVANYRKTTEAWILQQQQLLLTNHRKRPSRASSSSKARLWWWWWWCSTSELLRKAILPSRASQPASQPEECIAAGMKLWWHGVREVRKWGRSIDTRCMQWCLDILVHSSHGHLCIRHLELGAAILTHRPGHCKSADRSSPILLSLVAELQLIRRPAPASPSPSTATLRNKTTI